MLQQALFAEPPRARRHDPITSHVAAKRFSRGDAHRSLIVSAIRSQPGATYREIAEVTGLEPVAVGRRLIEVERIALVRPGEPRDNMRTWYPA
jgi:predicted transcriptional regulator